VEALFQEAVDLDPARRDAYLDQRCAGDPELRAAVMELLHFDARAQSATGFWQGQAADLRLAHSTPVAIGQNHLALPHPGETGGGGGMGVVYKPRIRTQNKPE